MPVIQKIQKKDMQGAVAVIISSPDVLRLVAQFDAELPRTILEQVLLKPAVQSTVEQAKERMPTEKLKEPFKRLQDLSKSLDADAKTVTSKTAEVIRTFQKSSRVLLKRGFHFPTDLVHFIIFIRRLRHPKSPLRPGRNGLEGYGAGCGE